VVEHVAWPDSVSAQAEQAALTRPELLDGLARNPFISEEAWFALYPAKLLPPAPRALCLVRRPLSAAQVAQVAANETRSSVLEEVLAHYEIDQAAQQRLACGKGLSQTTAQYLLEAVWVDDRVKELVARKASGVALLRWLANSTTEQCSTESGAALMRAWPEWTAGKKLPSSLCRGLVDKRPDLHPAVIACGPGHGLYDLVLASRYFTSEALAYVATAQLKARAGKAKIGLAAARRMYASSPMGANFHLSIRRTEALLRHCELQLADLIANPAVSPAQARHAKAAAASFSIRSGANAAESAFCRRAKQHVGAYDLMGGALTTPYEQISDAKTLDYLLSRLALRNDGQALASLACNPYLGKRARDVAARLRFGLGRDLRAAQRREVMEQFCSLYPQFAEQVAGEIPLPGRKERQPGRVCTPIYLTGELSSTKALRHMPSAPVLQMPQRYPLSLNLISTLGLEPLAGVAHYLAKRLGTNATAWQTCFALADELASSDLDTLCDTALALSE
jgi:hypothetical protein